MKNKTKNSIKSVALILAVVAIIGSFGGIFNGSGSSGSGSNGYFTASTQEYKDLQKFVGWQDANGKIVSTRANYRYKADAEKELTAVYEDIEFTVVGSSSSWDLSTHTLTTAKWTDINYVEMPLVKGMSVTVEVNPLANTMVGLANSEDIANPAENSWVLSASSKLFAPEFNIYMAKDITQWREIQNTNAVDYDNCSIPWSKDIIGNTTLKIKYVLADTIEMYIDDVLVTTTSSDISFEYDKNDTYYLSFWATSGTVKLLEFGWDKDTEQVFSGVALTADYYSGKKITFLGDSITCGVGATNTTTEKYSTVLSTMLGATENNMGNSGWVIATGGVRNSQLQNVSKIPKDSDLVIVMLGTNDQNLGNSTQYKLGNDGDTSTTTEWGATEAMCKQLAEMFKGTDTKVIICTPPIQKGYSNDRKNSAGYSLRDISNVLMTCARRNGLLYADLNACGYLTDSDMADGLHPNTSGHNKIAQYLAKYILSGFDYYTPYK